MAEQLDDDDIAKIEVLAAVIVAKVLDELAPNSETIAASDLALGAFACTLARSQLQNAALSN